MDADVMVCEWDPDTVYKVIVYIRGWRDSVVSRYLLLLRL